MPASGQIFYVAGAGVSGLTLALALAKFGATVVVLERQATISEFGAGIQISPNARRVLDGLGLSEAINARSFEPNGIDIYPLGRSEPLLTLALGNKMRQHYGAAYSVMHRADLVDALYKATRRFANVDILFGVRDWDAVSHAHGVTVSIDEADGQTRTGRGRALLGADGVHSATRTRLLGGPVATDRKATAWRTLLPFDSVAGAVSLDRVSVMLAPSVHMVCYPLPHRRQLNVALFTRASGNQAPLPELPAAVVRDGRLAGIVAVAGDTWTSWPLYTVETRSWHAGNIGLVGDAAHAMLPFQAQGAAMGIEDAAVLAPSLVEAASAEVALADYARRRQTRVRRVTRTAEANGRIFHLPKPLAMARDLVMSAQGPEGQLRRLAWLYSYDAKAGTD